MKKGGTSQSSMRLKPLCFGIVFAFLGFLRPVFSDQSLSLKWAQKAPEKIQVGDHLHFELALPDTAIGKKVKLVPSNPEQSQYWYFFPQKWHPKKTNHLLIEVAPLGSGKRNFPELELRDGAGAVFGKTDAFSLQIVSARTAGKVPPSVLSLWNVAFPWGSLMFLMFLVLGVIIVIVYVLIQYSRRKKTALPQMPKTVIVRSPFQIAQEALLNLKRKNFLKKGAFKKLGFGFSEVFKTYLEAEFRGNLKECTTREMLSFLKTKISQTSFQELKRFFFQLDTVKFTDTLYEPSVMQSWFLKSQNLLETLHQETQKEKNVVSL